MPDANTDLPRWDMTVVYPGLDSAEFAADFDDCISGIQALEQQFDHLGIQGDPAVTSGPPVAAAYDSVTAELNALLARLHTLWTYVGCHTSTDARNQLAQSRDARLGNETVRLNVLITRYEAWLGSIDIDHLVAASQTAAAHAHAIRKAAVSAAHQMTPGEERLAAELAATAIDGWVRLHSQTTALLTADVHIDGEVKTLPMSAVRALSHDPDRAVRKRAYEAELKAWETVEVPIAACLNGVKGWQGTIRRNHRFADDIAPTLLMNNIDAEALGAMQAACADVLPDLRRYLGAKGRALGVERMGWYDMDAPVGGDGRRWSWREATGFILTNFGAYSDRMAGLAASAFNDSWIDAEPRVGKEGGAYCASLRAGESRIMMNFDGSFGSVSTLAHELGHAYHNLNLANRTRLQRDTPMALAETASIFCETIVFEAAVERAGPEETLSLLNTALQRDTGVIVDIQSRFLFEKRVFERRAERDLTIDEIKELMTQSQVDAYGDALDPLHPYMWAVKGHYYGPLFYNYPYTCGLLFALGLYSVYRERPDEFRSEYDDFLASTGLEDAAPLTARFGIDIRTRKFWDNSLAVVRQHVDRYEQLIAGRAA